MADIITVEEIPWSLIIEIRSIITIIPEILPTGSSIITPVEIMGMETEVADLQLPRVLQTEELQETALPTGLPHQPVLLTEGRRQIVHLLQIICHQTDQVRREIEVVEDLAVEVAEAEAAEVVVVLVEAEVAEAEAEVAEEDN